MADWNKIKADYLKGFTPKELSEKYGVVSKTISNRATNENWTVERGNIKEEISKNVKDELSKDIKDLSRLAVYKLKEIIENDGTKDSDLIAAIGKVIDISGLKEETFNYNNDDFKITVVSKKEDEE